MPPREILLPVSLVLFLLLSSTRAFPADPAPSIDPQKALDFATSDDSDFKKLTPPQPGEWLAVHPEPAQSFDQYVRSRPVRPAKPRILLVLQPLGPFDPDQKALLAKAAAFAKIFFQLDLRTENDLPLPADPAASRVNPYSHNTQYLSPYLLDRVLLPKLPPDAVACLGVTMADLYPESSWNFVFGQANLTSRVGVYSFVRYAPAFYGQPRTPESDLQLLRRTCKVLSHETGHIFGLSHCTFYQCGMNGSNSLPEADSRPLFFCPVCLKKLQWNIRFDVPARYQAMQTFFAENHLDPEAQWLSTRLSHVRQAAAK